MQKNESTLHHSCFFFLKINAQGGRDEGTVYGQLFVCGVCVCVKK